MSVQHPLYIISADLEAIPYQRHLTRWVSDYIGLSISRLTHASTHEAVPYDAIKIIVGDSIELYHGEELLGVLERAEGLLPKSQSCIIVSLSNGSPVVLTKSSQRMLTIAEIPVTIGSQTIATEEVTFIVARGYCTSASLLAVPIEDVGTSPCLSRYLPTIKVLATELMTCCVCYEEHSRLKEVCSNKHHYCNVCVAKLRQCPLCREMIG